MDVLEQTTQQSKELTRAVLDDVKTIRVIKKKLAAIQALLKIHQEQEDEWKSSITSEDAIWEAIEKNRQELDEYETVFQNINREYHETHNQISNTLGITNDLIQSISEYKRSSTQTIQDRQTTQHDNLIKLEATIKQQLLDLSSVLNDRNEKSDVAYDSIAKQMTAFQMRVATYVKQGNQQSHDDGEQFNTIVARLKYLVELVVNHQNTLKTLKKSIQLTADALNQVSMTLLSTDIDDTDYENLFAESANDILTQPIIKETPTDTATEESPDDASGDVEETKKKKGLFGFFSRG